MAGIAADDDVEGECQICMENPPDVRMSCGHQLCSTCCVAEISRINAGGDTAAHSLEVRCYMCRQSGVSFHKGDADVTRQILERAAARLARAAPLHAQAEPVVVPAEQGLPEEDSGWSVARARSRARQPEQSSWVVQPSTARLDDFSVVPSSKGRHLDVQLHEERSLTDEDFQHLAPAIALAVQKAVVELDWQRPVALDVRLQYHQCGDAGIKALCEDCLGPLLKDGWAYCHFLRAWSNQIGDAGCQALAELLKLQGQAPRTAHMRELHLSDNRISSEGALALVRASLAIYPQYEERGRQRLPLWLRLHRNVIDTDAFFAEVNPKPHTSALFAQVGREACCSTLNPKP
jgi:hypothetical protein